MGLQDYKSIKDAVFKLLIFNCLNKKIGIFYLLILSPFLANAQILFEDVTTSAGGPFHVGESWGASWGHINSDVYPDLFVSNHAMKSSLLLNNGDGTFSEKIDVADIDGALTSTSGVKGDVHGGAWADFDNDGDQDLLVTRSSGGSTVYLFENNGQGEFTEERQTYGTGTIGGGRLPMMFDYNNDGRLDLAVSGNEGNDLFKWNGFRFVDQSFAAGVSGECLRGHSLGASDFFPDDPVGSPITPIYFCNSASRNIETAYDTSTFPFTDVKSKFDTVGTTADTLLADFNNDLKMDMFALRGNRINSGAAKISNTRIEAWLAEWSGNGNYFSSFSFSASGPITIDLAARTTDNPSRVYIGGTSGNSSSGYQPSNVPFTLDPSDTKNWGGDSRYAPFYMRPGVHIKFDETNQKWTITLSGFAGGDGVFFKIDGNGFSNPVSSGLTSSDFAVSPVFFLNNGNRLVNSGALGIGAVMCGGMTAADFDNDMDVDLYLVCKNAVGNIINRLYLNNGSGIFSLASTTGAEGIVGEGIDSGAGTGETAVTADYDIDGLMDLFVTNGSRLFPHFHKDGYTAGGPDQFFRNITSNNNNWIQVDLIGNGVDTNRDAFGAKVFVTAGGVQQLREQNGKLHRWSHDHKRLHFGLANNTVVNIEVRWPNGDVDNHYGVSVNKLYQAIQNGSLTDVTPNGGGVIPSISINNASVVEGGTDELLVTLSTASDSEVSVEYQTNQQTAFSGIDYVDNAGVLLFSPGETSKIISVTTLQDSEVETDETFVVTLGNALGASIIQDSGVITIIDDDGNTGNNNCGQPSYSLSNSADKGLYVWYDCSNLDRWSIRAITGGGASSAYQGDIVSSQIIGNLTEVSIESSDSVALSSGDTSIDYMMGVGGPWQDGFDFTVTSGADLCLTLNDVGLPVYYGVNAVSVVSPVNLNEIFTLCNSAGSIPSISVSDALVSEGVGTVDITLSLSEVSTDTVSVSYSTIDGAALAGFDYSENSGSVDFLAGELSKVISISIIEDAISESIEQFTLNLSAPVNASISNDESVITITDNDVGGNNSCGQPSYLLSNINDKGLYMWQDCANPEQWSIRVIAGGGSSTTYDGVIESSQLISNLTEVSVESSDSVVLSSGDTNIDFMMTVGGPWLDGFDFTAASGADLCLSLNNVGLPAYYGVNAVPIVSPVNLNDIFNTCNNTSSLPSISVDDVSVFEGAGSANVTLSLSDISTDIINVFYSTVDGTAVAGLDYSTVTGTVNFLPGEQTKTVSIPIIQDAIDETVEQFTLILSNLVNVEALDIESVISINDVADVNPLVCGEPNFSPANDAGMFIWKDCGSSESWHFTASGGSTFDSFSGSIITSSPMISVVPIGFESSDSYQLTNGDQLLEFNISTGGGWTDGLEFDLGVSTVFCVEITSNMSNPIIVGSSNTIVSSPFNLNTLEACP